MPSKTKLTLSEQIYQELRKDIIKQSIPCGQKLTLQTLKDQFNVSHTPIREALTRLNEEGLVTYYSNCGVTVVTFTEQDINELFQFIGELDSLAVQFCKFSFSPSPLLFELEELLKVSEKNLSENKLTEWQSCSEDFHLIFYKYSNNHYLNDSARKLRAKVALLSNLYQSGENIQKIHQDHKDIFKTIQNGDFDKAASLMRVHSQFDVVFALKAFSKYNEKN